MGRWKYRVTYGTLPETYQVDFADMHDLGKLLRSQTALDYCYRANAELMWCGASMNKRFNNPYLVEGILKGV